METMTQRRYKVDIEKINDMALQAAFGESRFKVNEDGLSPQAMEAKKSVMAIRTAAALFVREALASITERVTPTMRREIEQIAVDAIEAGADCIDYLKQFCEEVRT